MFWPIVQAIFLFGLVLVLAWLSTRMVGYRMGLSARGRMVRVLENVPAGRDRTIMLLEVGGRVYLVGSTADRISLIDAIEDPAVIERLMAHAPAPEANPLQAVLPGNFREVLAKLLPGAKLGAGPAPTAAEPQESAEAERLKQQLERLRRMQEKDQ